MKYLINMERRVQVNLKKVDGKPYAVKVARTVWRRGKDRDNFKVLPIPINRSFPEYIP